MSYSREYLNFAPKTFREKEDVTQNLINKLVEKKQLTLSEAKFIGPFVQHAKTNVDGRELLNDLFNEIPEYRFWVLYLTYRNDILGEGLIIGPRGPISQLQKENELVFLEKQYNQWKSILYNLKNSKTDLQYLTKESRDDIKEALNYSRQIGEGSRRREMIERTLVLHSKYVYSKIIEYYQEYDVKKDTINICEWEIVIDSFAYAHIAIRHMAETTKFGRPGKTFIYDREIEIDCLPRVLNNFIVALINNFGCRNFDGQRIFLRFNGRNYVIRFRKFIRQVKGGAKVQYLRLETFYPAELGTDASVVKGLTLQMINEKLGFYI